MPTVAESLAEITSTRTGSFNLLHSVTDPELLQALMASMRENGWVGAPIVSEGDANAWTGVHRVTAAMRLWNYEGICIEIHHVDVDDLCAQYGIDWEQLVDDHDGESYEAAATLRGLLPEDVSAYLGFDVDGQA